jgi:hypothetical protein
MIEVSVMADGKHYRTVTRRAKPFRETILHETVERHGAGPIGNFASRRAAMDVVCGIAQGGAALMPSIGELIWSL